MTAGELVSELATAKIRMTAAGIRMSVSIDETFAPSVLIVSLTAANNQHQMKCYVQRIGITTLDAIPPFTFRDMLLDTQKAFEAYV